MALRIVSVDEASNQVVVNIAGRELVVQEVEGQFKVVSGPDLKPGNSIAAMACRAAYEALKVSLANRR